MFFGYMYDRETIGVRGSLDIYSNRGLYSEEKIVMKVAIKFIENIEIKF